MVSLHRLSMRVLILARSISPGLMVGGFSFARNNPMVDDRKHPNRVPVYLTDQEFLDLSREAMSLDKPVGEHIRFVLRRDMYGTVGLTGRADQQSASAFKARE
ncbi:MAG: hypothetical protein ACOYNF_13115 [Rhodoferax sp.]